MAAAFTGAHFAQPEDEIRSVAVSVSPSSLAAPLRPTAPIREPPNQAASPRSCRLRMRVLRSDIPVLLR
jgi:hypothetical protein